MRLFYLSNTLLSLGVVMLVGMGVMELTGLPSDPLLPATAAFCLGCTAVIDRVGLQQLK